MPRAVVTGAYGQDGALLVRQLASAGWEVHGTARRIESGPAAEGVTVHEADLTDAAGFVELVDRLEPDLLVNLAGISSVAQSWKEPELTSEVSGRIVVDLVEACRRIEDRTGRQVRFVQASSSEIFGAPEVMPQNEDTPLAPISPYGAAKAYAHLVVQVARRRGQFASNAILYNHESPDRPLSFVTRKITRGVAEIVTGRADSITLGNLDARRDWSWAGDVIRALQAIATAQEPGDFVVASGVSHSVRDFVAAAFAAAGIDDWQRHVRLDPELLRPSDAPEMRGDASRITRELGWHPDVTFEEMVARMVRNDISELSGSLDSL